MAINTRVPNWIAIRPWMRGPGLCISPCVTSRALNIGYGRIQKEIFDGLEAAGNLYVLDETVFGWDYRIHFGWPRAHWFHPDSTVDNADESDIIIHTMFESENPPENWSDVMNHAKLIWTPSHWCAGLFKEWGVKRPIMVSPYGVNTDDFPIIPRRDDVPFTYAAIAHSMMGRKGAMDVLKAFVALKMVGKIPGARLIVKTQKGLINDSWLFDEEGKSRKIFGPDGQEITGVSYEYGSLSQEDYSVLMGKAHILVYPQHGEGFGLIPIEFAATGGAAMVTDYSGCKEYTDPRQMVVLPDSVSQEQLMDKMEWAYHNRIEVRKMGESSAQWVRANWSWELAGLKARQALYENLGK